MRTNPFRHDRRPRYTPPPHVMSQQEIRWWIQELRRRGWRQSCLGRTLGLANPRNVWRKADGREWIYRSEQIRMSYVLRRIISGELVQLEGREIKGAFPGRVARAVLADRPEPLHQPAQFHIDLARRARVSWVIPPPPLPALPNFKTILENVQPWESTPWPGTERSRVERQ